MCDGMGHLTTRQYMALFDDASYQLLSEVSGWSPGETDGPWHGKGWADVCQTIEYRKELRAGSLIRIEGCVRAIGRTSVTYVLQMQGTQTGEVVARLESKTVHFNLIERRAIPIGNAMRSRMERFIRT